ncbi:hypothetical protein XELAEV_18006624mg [Xenopus laevis]|uniref:Uncharacterized protein n=1 Tax=Xenopus laevis TaxID=8355 RepID=A0A974I4J0_XENLA|nr:hypothetical protein XELAEV_18006624mg [Xenopus laevis]
MSFLPPQDGETTRLTSLVNYWKDYLMLICLPKFRQDFFLVESVLIIQVKQDQAMALYTRMEVIIVPPGCCST